MGPTREIEGRSHRTILIVVLVAVAGISADIRWRAANVDMFFGTDEADYERAVEYGLPANYFGTRERSGLAFLSGVAGQYRATGWARPFKEDWDAADAAGLRHYHPPLGLYPAAAIRAAGLSDERTLRQGSAITSSLACVASALLAWTLLPGSGVLSRGASCAAAGLLTAVSPFHITGGAELGPHAMFSLCSTFTLVALTCFGLSGTRGWWRAIWFGLGLTLLTLPYWALLLPSLAWTLWRVRVREDRTALAVEGAAVLGLTLLIVWPPYVLAGGFVKPIAMYLGILAHPLPGAGTPGSWLETLGEDHAILVSAIFVLLAQALVSSRARARLTTALPVVLFCISFLLLNIRVSHMKPLYGGDVIPAAAALAGLAVGSLPGAWLALGLTIPLAAAVQIARVQLPAAAEWRASMASLRRQLADQKVLVTPRPAGAIVAYYMPSSHVVLDSGDASDLGGLRSLLASHEIDVVLRLGDAAEPGGIVETLRLSPGDSDTTAVGTSKATWWRLRQ